MSDDSDAKALQHYYLDLAHIPDGSAGRDIWLKIKETVQVGQQILYWKIPPPPFFIFFKKSNFY